MNRLLSPLLALTLVLPATASAQQTASYDYCYSQSAFTSDGRRRLGTVHDGR